MTAENAVPFPDNIRKHSQVGGCCIELMALQYKLDKCLRSRICKRLPGVHAFAGCDSVSAFSGKGKLMALKLGKRRPAYQDLFQHLGVEWKLSDELFVRLQEFTCLMYSSNPGTKDVNLLRYRLFCARKGVLESHQLPPCQDTLRKHCERANYPASVRESTSFQAVPVSLTDYIAMTCVRYRSVQSSQRKLQRI